MGEKQTITFEDLRPGMKLENGACRWEVLSLPRFDSMNAMWGARLVVRARVEFIIASYSPREVDLKGYASEELEVML